MSEKLNTKEYLRKLVNIAYINIAIPLVFFIWVYLESTSNQLIPITDYRSEKYVFFGTLIFGTVLVFLGHRRFELLLNQSKQIAPLYGKLLIFQKALTIRFIAYAVASSLFTIGFYVTNYQPFTFLFGLMIVLFSIHSPNARRVAKNLKLKKEDRLILLEGLDIPKIL